MDTLRRTFLIQVHVSCFGDDMIVRWCSIYFIELKITSVVIVDLWRFCDKICSSNWNKV